MVIQKQGSRCSYNSWKTAYVDMYGLLNIGFLLDRCTAKEIFVWLIVLEEEVFRSQWRDECTIPLLCLWRHEENRNITCDSQEEGQSLIASSARESRKRYCIANLVSLGRMHDFKACFLFFEPLLPTGMSGKNPVLPGCERRLYSLLSCLVQNSKSARTAGDLTGKWRRWWASRRSKTWRIYQG